MPAAIAGLPLTNQAGRPVKLSDFRGRTVVLANFLTSCQEACPLTTGALETMSAAVESAHLSAKVVFAEVSIDPGRDSPSRLAAYAAYTGAHFDLLTGRQADLDRLWGYFGIYYEKVAEGSPPGTDWQTGRPYTYDMDHQDGFVLIDARGHERFITVAMPDLHGKLAPRLYRLLDGNGRQNLDHPAQGTWTVQDGLAALGWVLGRDISTGR
ncbi:MAG TPA: SCO family protein [Acidimicrobiales bacterium]|nr:SCO family protein [Acidimicrobiales bacterium]